MDSRNLLFWMLLCASSKCDVNGQLASGGEAESSTCPVVSKIPTSRHFTVYGLLPKSTVNGCTGTVIERENFYQENHAITIKNSESTMIYLTIRGIQQGTTSKQLPQNREYKYLFALFSNKDVKWLPVLENMPSNNVSYKFWYQKGSEIIRRVGLNNFHDVEIDISDIETSHLFQSCKRPSSPFGGSPLTSFSEITFSDKANITILANQPTEESSTKCEKIEEDFLSPRLEVREYESVAVEGGCDADKDSLRTRTRGRAFILDMTMGEGNYSIPSIVHVEITGSAEKAQNTGKKTIVVLKSNVPTRWIVNVGLAQKSVNYVFVTSRVDKVERTDEIPNVEHKRTNLDYSEHDQNSIIDSVAKLYDSDVVSYMKYRSKVDLVFLSLDPLPEYVNNTPANPDRKWTIMDVGNAFDKVCDGTGFKLTLPRKILAENALLEDDLTIGDGNCDIFQQDKDIIYVASERCGMMKDGNKVKVQLKFKFRSDSFGNLPLFDPQLPLTEKLDLSCTPASTKYKLEVFSDFELEKRVKFPRIVQIPRNTSSEEQKFSEKTFHFKVSIQSRPKMMSFLQECSVNSKTGPNTTIIKNNCAVHSGVSFVRPYEPTRHQHFAVQFEKTLIGMYNEFNIQCEIGSCLYEDGLIEEIDTVPQCIHIHGDHCSPVLLYNPPPAVEKMNKTSGRFIVSDLTLADETTSPDSTVTTVLGIFSFIFGCALILAVWKIHHCSKQRPAAPRENSKRSESNSSGSSHSTRSTRTSNGSSKSFLCFKTEKETTPTSTEKQDNSILLKPLIDSPTSQKCSLTNNTTTKIITTYPEGSNTSKSSSLKEEPGCLKQDGRHLFVSAGNGYLGMPIRSAQVDSEVGGALANGTGHGAVGCASEGCHRKLGMTSDVDQPSTSKGGTCNGSVEHPVLLSSLEKEYMSSSQVGNSTAPPTSYQTTPKTDCTKTLPNGVVDWRVMRGFPQDFDNLKEVDL